MMRVKMMMTSPPGSVDVATPTAVVDLFDTIFFMCIKSFSLSL